MIKLASYHYTESSTPRTRYYLHQPPHTTMYSNDDPLPFLVHTNYCSRASESVISCTEVNLLDTYKRQSSCTHNARLYSDVQLTFFQYISGTKLLHDLLHCNKLCVARGITGYVCFVASGCYDLTVFNDDTTNRYFTVPLGFN
jgi:hypothetical protein